MAQILRVVVADDLYQFHRPTQRLSRYINSNAARQKLQADRKLAYARDQVEKTYIVNIAQTQT